ncbi:hypothetical protein COD10_30045 [Bacillus thuringiensis]|uniref:hypothetical protein n=1 Tax=Bacillus TaxID=1386 RepID=UPI000BED91CA|nr:MULTISPECIES: hypothetical protein [Bacillus]PEF29217.1 hypothetical protein CON39_18495 [Bacillus thuringiensis]PET91815.1 hypothetical protein CN529_06950 [Bacillus thuringiensis]PEU98304.1 hypothetical protein CN409_12625 [Bacillus sp. AFS012607]PEY55317.1 hypothetical protein CN359_14355 [Bacillus thuringiensis]PFA37268.1 hypothetical protein CN416_20065 [Bacillus thuringiensis]
MADTTSLFIFGMLIAFGLWLFYIPFKTIKKWDWEGVELNKKTHGNGSLRKNNSL